MRSTNYYNTFVSIADHCKKLTGVIPPEKNPSTVARMQYDIISKNPYQYTSDEIIFEIYCLRKGRDTIEDFFNKSQACFRCSPLPKNYGWGFHFDADGKVAIYGVESAEYQKFIDNGDLKQRAAFSPKN